MKIAIGNDHAAVDMKNMIMVYLDSQGYEVVNMGTNSSSSADYPLYAKKVAEAVHSGECDLGIAICGTGIGMSMSCNKIKGIRAACCSEPYSAKLARTHNNANVLCFGSRVVGPEIAKMMVDEFLNAQFAGGRHADRIAMIAKLEESYLDTPDISC